MLYLYFWTHPPIRPATFRRDIIDLVYQGGRAAKAPSTLRAFNTVSSKATHIIWIIIFCIRADVLLEPYPPCNLSGPSAFKLPGRTCCQSSVHPEQLQL